MFSTIKGLWKEARADVALQEALDIIQIYGRLDGYRRYELTSAFDYTKGDLELEYGPCETWKADDKLAVAKQLMKGAREGYKQAPSGASGMALLSLYLEAQTLPGEKATQIISAVESWYAPAKKADIERLDENK